MLRHDDDDDTPHQEHERLMSVGGLFSINNKKSEQKNMSVPQTSSHEPSSKASSKTTAFVYLLTAISAIGGFLFGYDTGVISGSMILLKRRFGLTLSAQELVVSITVGFAAVSSLVGGQLNDWLGRRLVILMASVAFAVGSAVLFLAQSVSALLAGRAIVGIGVGLSSMTIPIYISEIAPNHIRGRLVTTNILFVTGGQFVAACVDALLSDDKENGWRYMLGIMVVPAAVLFVGFLFLPDSPPLLVARGRLGAARQVLERIGGSAERADADLNALVRKREAELLERTSLMDVFRSRPVRRALVVGCGMQIFQQITGINTVMYYGATIIQMAGIANVRAIEWLAAVVAFGNFSCTIIGLWLVERSGRRALTRGSLIGVGIGLAVLAVSFQLGAYFSPSVNFIEVRPPPFASDACASLPTCFRCERSVSAAHPCGYCFSHENKRLIASCLSLNSSDPAHSNYGRCDEGSVGGVHWLVDSCPNRFAWMAIVGLLIYIVSFAPGMGPMPWIINSEIYPTWARSTCVALATSVNLWSNLLVSSTFLTLTKALTKFGAFWLYACFAVLAYVFANRLLPETRGRSLDDVERLFDSSSWYQRHRETAQRQQQQLARGRSSVRT